MTQHNACRQLAVLTAAEVATLAGVSAWTVRAWARAGIIPHVKSGARIVFRRHEVEMWLAGPKQPELVAVNPTDLLQLLLDGQIELVVTARKRE